MSDREKDMGRLAAREEQTEDSDADSGGREDTQDSPQRAEADERSNPPSESDAAESASGRSAVNVKDRGATMFAYLPQSLDNDVDLACQSVNLTYQRESGEKLGKNRYLYPIILMVGADNAVDLSYDEIRALVERVDEVEDAV